MTKLRPPEVQALGGFTAVTFKKVNATIDLHVPSTEQTNYK